MKQKIQRKMHKIKNQTFMQTKSTKENNNVLQMRKSRALLKNY